MLLSSLHGVLQRTLLKGEILLLSLTKLMVEDGAKRPRLPKSRMKLEVSSARENFWTRPY